MKISQLLETNAWIEPLRAKLVAAGENAFKVFDQNIAMFSKSDPNNKYTGAATRAALERLQADRAALAAFINGDDAAYSALSVQGKELLNGIPDWGRSGT